MAAVSSAPTGATALTPPSSSHGDNMWELSAGQSENTTQDKNNAPSLEQPLRSPLGSQNGNALSSSYGQTSNHFEMAARKMHSVDNLSSARWAKSGDGTSGLSPALAIEPRQSLPSASDGTSLGKQTALDERRRQIQQTLGLEYSEEDSKWIHRDKLAKIESEELQAAGFIIPKVRASSRQRRPRGQNSVDYDNQQRPRDQSSMDFDNQHQQRQRHDSANINQVGEEEPPAQHWDLRTPEEIAEEEANAYFASQSLKGGTKIPVAKVSPAPIPQDYLDRGSPSVRRIESMDGDTIAYTKTRSRSASASTKDFEVVNNGNRHANGKRSVTEGSPKKSTVRKASTASKTSTTASRPKTRSGPTRDASGNRPPTRSGEPSAASKQPEGDPPWMFDAYKPDPRLPPDQQLLPTVAKRLRQEMWEREGKFGDVYDKEFRPLNDHELPQPQEKEPLPQEEEDTQQAGEWPLKPGITKSPKQSSYSTMPKISDKPPLSPVASSKGPGPMQPVSQPQPVEPMRQEEEEAEKKAGCGCCVIM